MAREPLFAMRMGPEFKGRLRELAALHGLTMSGAIRLAVNRLYEQGKDAPAGGERP